MVHFSLVSDRIIRCKARIGKEGQQSESGSLHRQKSQACWHTNVITEPETETWKQEDTGLAWPARPDMLNG